MRRLWLNEKMLWMKLLMLAGISILLAGCASTLSANVTSFQQWPEDAAGQTYRLVPGPQQDASSLEYQAFADMIRASIGPVGLVEAAPDADARFNVSFHYENPRVQTWIERYDDAYFPGFGPYWGYYPYYGWGGPFYAPRRITVPVDAYDNKLTVTITDNAQGGRQVYQSTAVSRTLSDSLTQVMPYLAQAVFDGFPGNNGQVRSVEFKLN